MGTSSRYSGPTADNPLIPSWLQSAPSQPAEGEHGAEQPNSEPDATDKPESDSIQPSTPGSQHYPRFQGARLRLNKAARTGDRSYVRRAAGNYVSRGVGGSRSASGRMAVP